MRGPAMSADSAAERIFAMGSTLADAINFESLHRANGSEWHTAEVKRMVANAIREETRCDQLAEALRNMDAAAFRLRERLRTISGLSSGTNESIYNEACYYAEDDVFAETRALLAEIDAPAREGGKDAKN